MIRRYKVTVISGATATPPPTDEPALSQEVLAKWDCQWREHHRVNVRGHVPPEAALKIARKRGIVGPVQVGYSAGELDRRGEFVIDELWVVDESGAERVTASDDEQPER
jgi:hypothetical protein